MKTKIIFAVMLLLQLSISNVFSQNVTTVEAKNQDISDNLDLEAVASIFGDSKDLEDFERRLNDPDSKISNLDLNEDGIVDYLRVIETTDGNAHLITIQSVVGKDLYQDVATIDVEKEDTGGTRVQVVGNVYMYGPDYIIEPVYVRQPVFFVYFWGPRYDPWHSPYYYNYYPTYYSPWAPYPPYRYRNNVHVYVNVNNSYHYTEVRRSKTSIALQEKTRRNDYARRNPDKSFVRRNEGVSNRAQLKANRKIEKSNAPQSMEGKGKRTQENWSPPASVEKQNPNVPSSVIKAPNSNVEKVSNQVKKSNSSTREIPASSEDKKNKQLPSKEVNSANKKVESKAKVQPENNAKNNLPKGNQPRQQSPQKSEPTKKRK